MRRYLLALSVALSVLLAPCLAFADDGFLGGLQDLTGTREVEEVAETSDTEYVPVLHEVETVEVSEVGTQEAIEQVGNSFNSVPVDKSKFSLLQFAGWSIGQLAGSGRTVITAAVGLVFLWWGVRKALKIIMSAFRKGRASV